MAVKRTFYVYTENYVRLVIVILITVKVFKTDQPPLFYLSRCSQTIYVAFPIYLKTDLTLVFVANSLTVVDTHAE